MNYEELLRLVNTSISELKIYIEKYENGTPSSSIVRTSKVLEMLRNTISSHQEIEVYVLRGVQSISTAAVKEYDRTELETAILNIKRFMMKYIPGFNSLEPLRSDFDKYFP